MKTATPQKSLFRWPLVALSVIGVVGVYLCTVALIERDYVMAVFWFIFGDIPAAIALAIILKHFYVARRTSRQ